MKLMYRFKQFIILGGDFVVFCIAFWLSLFIRNFSAPTFEQITPNLVLFFFVYLLWMIINYINGLYDLRLIQSQRTYKRVFQSAIFSLIIGVTFFYILPQRSITPKTLLLLNVILGYTFIALWRLLYNYLIGEKKLRTNILFLGYTKEVKELVKILNKESNLGYKIMAICDHEEENKNLDHPKINIYKKINTLRPAISTHHINTVVTAPHINNNPEVVAELYELLFWPVQIVDLTSFYENVTGRIPPSVFSESWFLKNLVNKESTVYNKLRRFFDLIASLVFGIFLLIILPIVAGSIKLNSKGPIFFKQKRVGSGEQIFFIYKFRTMYALAEDGSAEIDGAEFAKKNDKRITAVGKLLRKTRIDELPQVWNLVRGDLTLIGPRPERPEIVTKLIEQMPFYPLRHTIKPGLTGWAQIHQHYTDTLETSLQKIQYDLYYIKNKSMFLDLSILLKTINVILRGMGQ